MPQTHHVFLCSPNSIPEAGSSEWLKRKSKENVVILKLLDLPQTILMGIIWPTPVVIPALLHPVSFIMLWLEFDKCKDEIRNCPCLQIC